MSNCNYSVNVYYNSISTFAKPIKKTVIPPLVRTASVSRSADYRRRARIKSIDQARVFRKRYALTLTAKNADSSELISAFQRLIKSLSKKHLFQYFYQVETARKSHIHAVIASPFEVDFSASLKKWCAFFDSSPTAQLIEPVYDLAGWLKYLAKPSKFNAPKNSRTWVASKNLPHQKPVTIGITESQFYSLKRSIKGLNQSRTSKKLRPNVRTHGVSAFVSDASAHALILHALKTNEKRSFKSLKVVKKHQAWLFFGVLKAFENNQAWLFFGVFASFFVSLYLLWPNAPN